ncbi:hypothetical protein HanXRQr2_Chr11g0476491 [Helianthus annuus]|uniref:Uncharacterized protein n=1 Tax=Helianthus annuus TaxID=4232 RepID=A0A9K3HME7_HELAN|nr:hypothetical protein HanXRQr2_Chr11g0476491 [Helianthus annuus]
MHTRTSIKMDDIVKFKWIMKHCQINCRICGDFLLVNSGGIIPEILLWEMLK